MAALPQNSSVTNSLARRNGNLCVLPWSMFNSWPSMYAQSRQLQLFWDHDCTLIFWPTYCSKGATYPVITRYMDGELSSCLYLINYLSLALPFLWAFPTSSWLPTIKCIPPGLLWVQLDWMRLCCSWRQSCGLLFLASLCDHPHHWTPNNRLCQVIATILEI